MPDWNPRTILLVHDGSGQLRGSEAVAFALLDGIDRQRYQRIVLTNHPEFAAACEARGIPTEFRSFRMLFTDGFRFGDLADLVRLGMSGVRLLRDRNITLVHLSNGGACSWMTPAAWLCGIPAVVHVHTHWSRRMRFILGLHFADRIVGVSDSVVAGFRSDPVALRRLSVIYSGLDRLSGARQDRSQGRAGLADGPDGIIVSAIAALQRIKRIDVAIEAIRRLPPDVAPRTRLLVVVEGPQRAHLEKQAAGLPVTFIGHRSDVHDLLLNEIDLVILPSESEAFGVVLLEAAAAGLPRIGSNIGGIREAITDGVDGVLVPAGDADALAAAIARLARDPRLRQRYGAAAEQRLHADLSVGRFLHEFTEIYDQLASTRPPTGIGKLRDIARSVWHQFTFRLPQAPSASSPINPDLDQDCRDMPA